MSLTLPEYLLASSANLQLVVPLSIACVAIAILVPLTAARGRLHIPGYVGLAFLAGALGFLCARFSGIGGIAGTRWGVLLSLLFFLLVAFAVGSVLALFFYRDPAER
jgi:hypothetical protein